MKVGFSPCPNDTFLFHAWVHGLIDGPPIEPFLADVEELNERATKGELPLTKLSIAALPYCPDYRLLTVGTAMGYGCGPKLVGRAHPKRVAIPGKMTTAAQLLQRYFPGLETVAMRYDTIIDAILRGFVDAGVIIHETRFTFMQSGLTELADLGELWHQETRLPLPLGGIALHKSIQDEKPIEKALRSSLRHAMAHPSFSKNYIEEFAQVKDLGVIRSHIATYVTKETLHLSAHGRQAINYFNPSFQVSSSTES